MLRSLARRYSIADLSKLGDFYQFQNLGSMLPPPEYANLPKIGLWTGGYEMFRDFAIVFII